MWCATIAIDLVFSAASIFFSTSVPGHQQGLAGALSNALLQLGITLGLGFADIVVSSTMPFQGRRQAYKNAFWLEVALGAVSFVVFMGFVWIEPAKADYTADEKCSIRESVRERESVRMSVEICGEAAPDDGAAAVEDRALPTTHGSDTATLPAEIDAADFAAKSVEADSASMAVKYDSASTPKEVNTASSSTYTESARQGNDVYLSF